MQTPYYQKLQVDQELTREKAQVIVENPDDLEFVLIFQDPDDAEIEYISGSILAGCSAADF